MKKIIHLSVLISIYLLLIIVPLTAEETPVQREEANTQENLIKSESIKNTKILTEDKETSKQVAESNLGNDNSKVAKTDLFNQVDIHKSVIETMDSEASDKDLSPKQIAEVQTIDDKSKLNAEEEKKVVVTKTQNPKNLMVICVEGLSRNTLYKLLNKNKLPNFEAIMKKGNNNGNYRNLELSNIPSEPIQTYQQLLTGQYEWLQITSNRSESLPKGITIFEHMKKAFPKMSVGAVLSSIQSNKSSMTFETLLSNTAPSLDYKSAIIPRTSKGVKSEVLSFLDKTKTQFFLFTNFTDVDVMGHHYREGAQRYSDAVKDCDQAIGEIIAKLKVEDRWEQTEFLITTNYGFKPKSQSHTDQIKSWILSSFKIRYKGTLQDVVPTILRYFKIDQSEIKPSLPGQKLIY